MDIDPKVDVAFKYLLSNPILRLAIINDIFEACKIPKVEDVRPIPGELSREKIMERGATLDFLATDDTGRTINIEMQRLEHANFFHRLFLHFAKIHNSKFSRGVRYEDVDIAPTYIIVFVDFSICEYPEHLNEYNFLHSTHGTPLEEDILRIIFLELPKLKELGENPSKDMLWCGFFQNNPNYEAKIQEYPMTQNAKELVNSITRDNELLSAYEEHLEWFNNYDFQLMSTERRGIKKGIQLGFGQGQTQERSLIKNIASLKKQGKSPEEIKALFPEQKDIDEILEILF